MTRQMGIGDLLMQGEIWISRNDEGLQTTKIADMKLNHILNLRRWLRFNARKLHSSEVLALYSMGSLVSGDAASDALDYSISQAEAESPLEWLADKPLFRALGQEIHRRQGSKGDASESRHLTKNERVELRHLLRPIDNTIQDVMRSLSPIEGMSHMSVAQWNTQVDSLLRQISALRRA
jgi:hypothetical protein